MGTASANSSLGSELMVITVPQRMQRCNIAAPPCGVLDLPILLFNMKNRDNHDNITACPVSCQTYGVIDSFVERERRKYGKIQEALR